MRKPMLLFAAVSLFILSFAATTYAGGASLVTRSAHTKLSADLPVLNLPVASLSQTQKVQMYNLITSFGVERSGVTPDSFDQAREVQVEPGDPMYVIPGTTGVCLIWRNASTCGDPVANGQIGLLDIEGGVVTGAGIASSSVSTIQEQVNGGSARIPVQDGTFVIGTNAGLRVAASSAPRVSVSVN